MPLKQSDKTATIKVNKELSPMPITSVITITEDASAWPTLNGVKQKKGMAYCDGSTLTNVGGIYDDFLAANGSLTLPNGPFRTNTVDNTVLQLFSGTSGFVVNSALAYAYCDINDDWYLYLNIDVSATNLAPTTAISVSGIVPKINPGTVFYPMAINVDGNADKISEAFFGDGSNALSIQVNAAATKATLSGTIPLESKPSWADANMSSYPVISLQTNLANAIGNP